MPAHKKTQTATHELATRFLGVFTTMLQLTKVENPDNVVAQLSVKQLQALDLIRREPGISQKALAEQLEVTSASVSIWIGKMLESKLVERWAHDDDARVMHLYLGPYGRELVNKMEQMQISTIADLLSDLPLEEQEMVVETLERALALRAQRLEAQPVENA
jgi:DNA-binding MarR family transcriptional regulator